MLSLACSTDNPPAALLGKVSHRLVDHHQGRVEIHPHGRFVNFLQGGRIRFQEAHLGVDARVVHQRPQREFGQHLLHHGARRRRVIQVTGVGTCPAIPQGLFHLFRRRVVRAVMNRHSPAVVFEAQSRRSANAARASGDKNNLF